MFSMRLRRSATIAAGKKITPFSLFRGLRRCYAFFSGSARPSSQFPRHGCDRTHRCASSPTTTHTQREVIFQNDITYAKVGDIDFKLDLCRPAQGKGPFPALIFFGGGGWTELSRMDYYPEIGQAARRGYVAVTADYRLTSVKEKGTTKYPFPAQLYDAKCAVRWLRANAAKYKIDSDHIGAIGFSAGAQLALMLGLTKPSDGLEGECGNAGYSSSVQAVVNQSGPTDLIAYFRETFPNFYAVDLLGGTPEQVPEQYKRASPLTYIRSDSPPILTIHGDSDLDVRPKHTQLLDAKNEGCWSLPHSHTHERRDARMRSI